MSVLVARWLALPPNFRGILWVAFSGVLFALLNVFTLIPAQHLNPYVMAFLRYFFGALFLVPFVMRLGLYRSLHTRRLPLHISRGAIHTAGMMLWFVALPLTTLAEITALGFTGPIFVTIGAALFLAEDVRLRRWIAVIVGFIGAMIIIRPGFGDIHLGVICILISTPIFSASNLISKALARTDSSTTIVIWQNIVIVICALPFALWFWQTPAWGDILWFLLAGAAGTLGHICQQRGYQLADITLLQPIGFLSLIWNTMLGYFLFFQKPDIWTFVGAAVIFGSALYISHREAVRRAQIKTAGTQANPEA
ncbi:DMT family transporter [Reyranella aquatilis]|uniref:DMT family transporter n=1 Tax=Reyranella aquatilis TaxID=2035356 RepID=A0ABS8KYP4_9HYPH|nr:DMT family transporter [Reyranella aquatilis]MCC8431204.1 DMT family transporter [Reyranella aquatilis]